LPYFPHDFAGFGEFASIRIDEIGHLCKIPALNRSTADYHGMNSAPEPVIKHVNSVRSATQRSASAVKKILVSASAIALLASMLLMSRDAWSQSGEKGEKDADIPHKVGLIDMAHIFKNYKKFEALREDLKTEISQGEEKAKALQTEIVELQKQIKENNLKEGGPEFAKIEKQLYQKGADFENFKRQKQREYLKAESKIYLEIYNEVTEMVNKYAKYYKYTLVMRFSREELDTENAQQLLQGMNRQVIYHRPSDDITDPILKKLNERYNPERTAEQQPERSEKPKSQKPQPR
jgi:outer membrane protein